MGFGTITQIAADYGFALAGVTAALPTPDAQVYRKWISRGLAGRMFYLTDRRADLRDDPRTLLPSARSIICVGRLYNPAASGTPIARYALDEDYHEVMRRDLESFVAALTRQFGAFDYKICVDTAPLLERSYARLAGLGWIGRNTCLINQQVGSWLFLGEILTSLDLPPDVPAPDRCGTCTRCIDACPTDAIRPGGLRTELDSTRCISYLTIELKGPIPEADRPGIGTHVFGCDICQEVCPWNETDDSAQARSLQDLADLSADDFRREFRHTPVWRTKYSGFLRNVAVAMGNSRESRYDVPLRQLMLNPDATVASHARWALSELEKAEE